MNNHLFTKLCGLAVIALTTMVMFGWLLHVAPMVQILPMIAPMQFNTSICFTMMAFSLLGIVSEQWRFARLCALAAAALAFATLLQYMLHLNYGILSS